MDKPAFPHTRVHPDTSGRLHDGLSRRELFAAIQTLRYPCSEERALVVRESIKDADALIAALDAEPPK